MLIRRTLFAGLSRAQPLGEGTLIRPMAPGISAETPPFTGKRHSHSAGSTPEAARGSPHAQTVRRDLVVHDPRAATPNERFGTPAPATRSARFAPSSDPS